MSKPARGIRPLRLDNLIGNIGFNHKGRAYAASAVLTKDNLVIHIGGNGYSIPKKILFKKSIGECINDILNQFEQDKEEETDLASTTEEGDREIASQP